jgi:dTDP-4-amino-4,6-dideoxygalactose transaminase
MSIDPVDLIFSGRGSSALWAILKCLHKPQKKILIPVNICEIVIPVIRHANFIPVFYDVNELTGNATLQNIKDAYCGDEAVLLAVHNFGQPLEIDKITDWAKQHKIFLIEDVCNALGAHYNGISLGLWGDASIFSFGYVKIIENGVGGAAFVRDKSLRLNVEKLISTLDVYNDIHKTQNEYYQSMVRELRTNNQNPDTSNYNDLYNSYINYLLYKIDNNDILEIIKAFSYLSKNIESRNSKASLYRKGIKSVEIKHVPEIDGQIYWRYNLLVKEQQRESIINQLRMNNLLVSTWYPPVIGMFYNNINVNNFPGAYSFGKQVVNLFVDHRVSENDINTTIDILNNHK